MVVRYYDLPFSFVSGTNTDGNKLLVCVALDFSQELEDIMGNKKLFSDMLISSCLSAIFSSQTPSPSLSSRG